jgi:hypothetical protein
MNGQQVCKVIDSTPGFFTLVLRAILQAQLTVEEADRVVELALGGTERGTIDVPPNL